MSITLPAFDYTHNGKTYVAEHAVVTQFALGREGHGVFTATVEFDTGSYQQGLGHYFLENEHGGPFIAQLVDRLGTPWRGVGVKTPVVIFRLKSEGHSGLIAGFAVLKNAQLGEPFFAKEHTGADG